MSRVPWVGKGKGLPSMVGSRAKAWVNKHWGYKGAQSRGCLGHHEGFVGATKTSWRREDKARGVGETRPLRA